MVCPLQIGDRLFLPRSASVSLSSNHLDSRNWRGEVEGVAIGHDLSTEDWEAAVENALVSFYQTPYILQKFHKAKRVQMTYYDFDLGDVRGMAGRPLLRPYYFAAGDKVRLGGIQAAVCPADKKILHGMVDSIIVPGAIKAAE